MISRIFKSFFLILLFILCSIPQQLSAADEIADTTGSVTVKIETEPVKSDVKDIKPEPPFPLTSYVQLWYIYEDVENLKKQEVTGDRAAEVSSGFSLYRARIEYGKEYGNFGGKLSARFDGGTPALLDAFGYYRFPYFNITLCAGQMKFPSAYEVGMKDTNLDFATRTTFSNEVINWALSKSPSSVSPFTSVQTYSRDTGIGLTGEYKGSKIFLYAGNGLGANMFVGGEEKKQIVYTNNPGNMFYGIRGDADVTAYLPVRTGFINSLVIGGHMSLNRHDNFLYNDTRTVLDMERFSWSADFRLSLYKRIHFTAMSGGGSINDNLVDSETQPNVTYEGFEVKLMGDILPGFLRIGYRFDSYTYNNEIFGGSDILYTHTAGVSVWPYSGIKISADYKLKITDGDLNPDLNDNILIIQTQFVF